MEDAVDFASRDYLITLALLVFARGLDFLSTWFATPTLVLEANPVAKRLGWKWGGLLNLAICVAVARWPVAATVIVTVSLLVAARNFKSAWIMRTLGEPQYRFWMSEVMAQTSRRRFLFSLLGETLPTALVGAAVMLFAGEQPMALAVGLGIVGYAGAVLFYTLLAVWRNFQGRSNP